MISPVKVWRDKKRIKKYLGKKGKIIAFTKIYSAPEEFKKFSPYFVAIVQLESQERLIAQITDFPEEEEVKVGRQVEVVLRKILDTGEKDLILYGLKFKILS